ncbi:MAG: glycosyltransferase family 8 protein [Sinimarinibacterium sp.]|jgi:lipopolysaccharide biosynthesis glycosyltransferase
MTLHVACAADANYVPHAAAMIHSLLQPPQADDVRVHFLHDALLAPELRDRLGAFVRDHGGDIRFHEVDMERLRGLPTMGRISQVMWLRVFLPELLPSESRVLYLDCDTQIVDDLQPLWRTDLCGAWLGAVANVFEPGKQVHAAALGLPEPRRYFNSGVLLMDLDAWRRERCAERILALVRDRTTRLVWPDQDALNVTFAGHWKALDPRWNCQNSLFFFRHAAEVFGAETVRAATESPGILHFEGGNLAKPWHYLCKHPMRSTYLHHRAATPWPLDRVEGRTWGNRLLRPLPMRILLPSLKFIHRVRSALDRRIARILPSP